MIPIIVVSHGTFCAELLNALKMIAGDTFGMTAVPLLAAESAEGYRRKLADAIREKRTDTGLLIVADIVGGTPYNSAVYLAKDAPIGVVSGLNLPMLLALGFGRGEESALDALIALAVARDSIGVKGVNLSKERNGEREKLSIDKN